MSEIDEFSRIIEINISMFCMLISDLPVHYLSADVVNKGIQFQSLSMYLY